MVYKKYFTRRNLNHFLFQNPPAYYQAQFPELKRVDMEWVSVRCCFHQERHPSLRINLKIGNFRCFACGARGRDILSFHRQRYHLSFKAALEVLGGQSC